MKGHYKETQKKALRGELIDYAVKEIDIYDEKSMTLTCRDQAKMEIASRALSMSMEALRQDSMDLGFEVEIDASTLKINVRGNIENALLGFVEIQLISEKTQKSICPDAKPLPQSAYC